MVREGVSLVKVIVVDSGEVTLWLKVFVERNWVQ